MADKRIRITELDFDNIKSNLKAFLKSQDKFKDFDFEGSGMSVLMDLLAYNTHYNAYYANMVANEMFLDTAVKRDSVLAHAKMLGYVPRSSTSPTARINVTVNNPSGSPTVLTMPRGTLFNTTVADTTYQYVVLSDISTTVTGGVYSFLDVPVREGTLVNFQYVNDASDDTQRFLIQDAKADTSTLKVSVREGVTGSATVVYEQYSNYIDVASDSEVYFLEAADKGYYEIKFGDGIIGKELPDGAVITISYLITNEEESNGANRFTLATSVGGSTDATISVVSNSTGGSKRESVDSVKFNAPRYRSSQNRAVTADDYKVIVPKLYPNVDAIQVWGGEDNDPPVYGKVFLCIKPKTGERLTSLTKQSISDGILANKSMVSITPEITDPVYLHIVPSVTVYWNPNSTESSESVIEQKVRDTIMNYYNTEIKNFDSVFRFSKLMRLIDQSDVGIVSNITTLKLERHIVAKLGQEIRYILKTYNKIYTQGPGTPSAISSTGFIPSGRTEVHFLDDDGNGVVRAYYLEEGTNTKVYTNLNQGTVNYATGEVVVDALNPASTVEPNRVIIVRIVPESNDVVSVRNSLLLIEEQDIKVESIVDKIATRESSAGTDYQTTSSFDVSRNASTETTVTTGSASIATDSSSGSGGVDYGV